MNLLKNKWMKVLLATVLIISFGLGAAVYHYGSQYERTASVYMKNLDWILPPSSIYRHISIDEERGNLYRCLGTETEDLVNTKGEVVESKSLAETEADETYESHGFPYVSADSVKKEWTSYKGRIVHSVWAVDEDTFAVSFDGSTPEEGVSGYMLFDENMNPILGNRMFEVILRESDGMRYFISSEKTFDGKSAKKECGFLNEKGEVAFTFDHVPLCVNDFSEGLAIVYDEKLCAYDKGGRRVFALEYRGTAIEAEQRQTSEEYAVYSPHYTRFVDGLAPVTLDGEKLGYINRKGKIVIEPIFEEAALVLDQTAAVCLVQGRSHSTLVNDRWGVIDLKGVQ